MKTKQESRAMIGAMGNESFITLFMVGILVSMVKLAKMAQILPDVALFCFMALIFVLAACLASLDPHQVWEHWEKNGCRHQH